MVSLSLEGFKLLDKSIKGLPQDRLDSLFSGRVSPQMLDLFLEYLGENKVSGSPDDPQLIEKLEGKLLGNEKRVGGKSGELLIIPRLKQKPR